MCAYYSPLEFSSTGSLPGSADAHRLCRGAPTLPGHALPGQAGPAPSGRCDDPATKVSHLRSNNSGLRRTKAALNAFAVTFAERMRSSNDNRIN